jgi:hypothetical protein
MIIHLIFIFKNKKIKKIDGILNMHIDMDKEILLKDYIN